MDALLQLNGNSSLNDSRFSRGRDMIRRAESAGSSFENTLDTEIAEGQEMSARDAHKARTKKKLMDACIEAESLFVGQMLKQMRNTIHKGEILNGGQTEEIFTDMLYDQYSLNLSKSANLGIAKQMYAQLSKNI